MKGKRKVEKERRKGGKQEWRERGKKEKISLYAMYSMNVSNTGCWERLCLCMTSKVNECTL